MNCNTGVAQRAAIIATCNNNHTQPMSCAACSTPAKHATTIYATCDPLHVPCNSKAAACNNRVQHATCNAHHPTRTLQHDETCRTENKPRNMQQTKQQRSATCSIQPTTSNACKTNPTRQQAFYNTQHAQNREDATGSTQPATRNVHHVACGTQLATAP
jgi:hypothetical protein